MIENKDFTSIPHPTENLGVSIAYVDNVWIKMMHYRQAGDVNIPHKHNHDHATLLAKGSVKVTVNGEESVFKAPCLILIHQDHLHQFESLEDDTLAFCVHGIREDGQIIDGAMIPKGIPDVDIVRKYGSFSKGTE